MQVTPLPWLVSLLGGEPLRRILEGARAETESRLAMQAERDSALNTLRAIDGGYATIEFEPDGTIRSANARFLQLMGYRSEELAGRHHRLFVDAEESASPAYAQFWQQLAAGQPRSDAFRRIGKGGREVWIQAVYLPVCDPGGRVQHVLKVATDITAERQLAADHAGQIAAIDKSQAVIEFDLNGRVLRANENFCNALGYQAREIVGQHHRLFVDTAERDSPAYEQFWKKLGRGEYDAGRYRRITKGGQEIWI